MQPTDHRGRPVGNPATSHGGHRPTPRLAWALRSLNVGPEVGYGYTMEDGQKEIDEYRTQRDSGNTEVPQRIKDAVVEARDMTQDSIADRKHKEYWGLPQ